MIERFQGEKGKQLLVQALADQMLVQGDKKVAELLADKVQLKELASGVEVISQDGHDNDLFFIVSGALSVFINGREVARRTSSQHVGEMALIDPTAKRSASVKTSELTVLAIVSEDDFSTIAHQSPSLWRRIAVELSNRLRERSKFHKQPNEKPMVFIASSGEMLPIASKIYDCLKSEDIVVKLWSDGVFEASSTTIETLMSVVHAYDFGIVVFGPDDTVNSRGHEKYAPRDNAVFELGLLMGGFGRERTFIVKPDHLDIKIPSDLLGLTCLGFDEKHEKVNSICDWLRGKVATLGAK